MELVKAAASGDAHRLSRIIRRKKTVEKFGVRALEGAAQKGHDECVRILLEVKKYMKDGDKGCQAALITASFFGNNKCVELLIPSVPDINMQLEKVVPVCYFHFQGSALNAAVELGHIDCVNLLLRAGAEANMNNIFQGATLPAGLDLVLNRTKCVRRLLYQPNVDCSFKDANGDSVLIRAARLEDPECLKVILAVAKFKGIDVNWKNKSGETALMLACKIGHDKCVKLLLAFPDIEINATDCVGQTALVYAIIGKSVKCVELILGVAGVEVFVDLNFGFLYKDRCSAMVLALDLWQPEIVLALLQAGAIPEDAKKAKRNPLMCMAALGNIPFVKSLQSSFSLTAVDDKNRSALYYAAKNNHYQCLKVLFESLSEEDKLSTAFVIGMNKLIKNSAKKVQVFQSLPTLLQAGMFNWDWYPTYFKPARRSLAKVLITNGYTPREFKWKNFVSTPLHHAFLVGDAGLVRYFLASLYLTSRDLNLQRDTRLRKHLAKNGREDIKSLHRNLCSTPWKLETLSFLKVSTLLTQNKRRQEIIDGSDLCGLLPEKLKNRLAFRSEFQGLNVKKWNSIPVNDLCLFPSALQRGGVKSSGDKPVELEYEFNDSSWLDSDMEDEDSSNIDSEPLDMASYLDSSDDMVSDQLEDSEDDINYDDTSENSMNFTYHDGDIGLTESESDDGTIHTNYLDYLGL